MGPTNYNPIAPIYATLEKLVFGNILHQSKINYFHLLPPNPVVLIPGCGNGNYLQTLFAQAPNATIHLADTSTAMLKRCIKNTPTKNKHNLICHHSIAEYPNNLLADVIIIHFFLDQFNNAEADNIIRTLAKHSSHETIWLLADFTQPNSKIQSILLKTMYAFFGFTTGLKNKKLPDLETLFEQSGLKSTHYKEFLNGFVFSGVYYKKNKLP